MLAMMLLSGCTTLELWVPPPLAESGEVLAPEGRGFFAWRRRMGVWRTSSGGLIPTYTSRFELVSPEGERVAVECRAEWTDRWVEQDGHRWHVVGYDHLCRVGPEDAPLAFLVLTLRDDRRRVGRMEGLGVVVEVGATHRLTPTGRNAPWEVRSGASSVRGYELYVGGRLVAALRLASHRLRVAPDLPPEARRSVGLAATLLAAVNVDSPGGDR